MGKGVSGIRNFTVVKIHGQCQLVYKAAAWTQGKSWASDGGRKQTVGSMRRRKGAEQLC